MPKNKKWIIVLILITVIIFQVKDSSNRFSMLRIVGDDSGGGGSSGGGGGGGGGGGIGGGTGGGDIFVPSPIIPSLAESIYAIIQAVQTPQAIKDIVYTALISLGLLFLTGGKRGK